MHPQSPASILQKVLYGLWSGLLPGWAHVAIACHWPFSARAAGLQPGGIPLCFAHAGWRGRAARQATAVSKVPRWPLLLVLAFGGSEAALPAGQVVAWGQNWVGQLGNGQAQFFTTPQAVLMATGPLAGKTVTQVSAGHRHACAVTSDGGVYCWGDNQYGQLGNASTADSRVPIAVNTRGVLAGKTVTRVSAGYRHACAMTSDGGVYCWGRNNVGQLGNDSTADSTVPVAVDTRGVLAGKTVTQIIAAGGSEGTTAGYTCALASDGGVYCWGGNGSGELGDGSTTSSTVPVAVWTRGVLAGKTVTQVSTGAGHTCALTRDGGTYCWGYNGSGQLGDGSMAHSPVPVAVDTRGVLAGQTVTQVSAGEGHTCALTRDGGTYCWGANWFGQLGNGSLTNSSIPVAVATSGVLAGKPVTQVSTTGSGHTCALARDGGVYCWGNNGSGQLGNASVDDSPLPVAVDTNGVLAGKTVTQVSVGGYHTCVLTSDDGVYCWGMSWNGQLGNGVPLHWSVPQSVISSGVLAGQTVTQVSAGHWHTCALTREGGAYCWGANSSGELGDGSMAHLPVPVAVDTRGVLAGQTVTQVSAGEGHTCALTRDGMVYCWGGNRSGQLGNASRIDSTVPVPVDTRDVLAGKTVTQVSAGSGHTCALTSDGGVYCWGSNFFGGLGNGRSTVSTVPVAVLTRGVLAGKTVTQVSAGSGHTCALASDGGVYCWGGNGSGELGNGSTTSSTVPVAVDTSGVLAGKPVTQVSTGSSNTCALTRDGGVYCWGWNGTGALGNANWVNSTVPVAVDALGVLAGKTVIQVDAGAGGHVCALTRDGRAYCWGGNSYGQLGNGSMTDTPVPAAVDTGGPLAGQRVVQVSAGEGHTVALTAGGAPSILSAIVTVNDKPFDGNTTATISGCTLNPAPAGVSCDTSRATARFADAAVGNAKLVFVTGLALGGGDGNYGLASTSASTTASILPAGNVTGPLITPVITGPSGSNGWYVGNVQVRWEVTDPDSPITVRTGCGTTNVTKDTAGRTLTCAATSAGGTNSVSVTIRRDTRAPKATASASPDANRAGWRKDPVTVTFSGTDGLSGAVTCDPPVILTSEGRNQSAAGGCRDAAGNPGIPLKARKLNIDLTAPEVSITTPGQQSVFTRNQKVRASYRCSDALSGVQRCAGTVANGRTLNTRQPITNATFTVIATDRAGNQTTRTVTYSVQ